MPHQINLTSPLGPLTLTSDGDHLTALDWGAGRDARQDSGVAVLHQAAEQLRAYFNGELRRFDLPLRPAGSPFQLRIWDGLCQIPHGEVWSYGQLARHCGTAARAVGGACGANPIPIIIPCHRIVAVNGPGGYSGQGGLTTKFRLLRLEGYREKDLFADTLSLMAED